MPEKHGIKPTRHGFGDGLVDVARLNNSLIALGADITGSVSMNKFAEQFADRFYSLGIAEQNIAGVAAGLALSGKTPVFSTYGVFSAMRDLDQIRISICYNNVHVVIGGAHAGISVGPDGATHQALEDIAVMRSLPNMTVLSPCDATQTRLATIEAVQKIQGPVYIRFGREAVPDFTHDDQNFTFGKAQVLKEGDDIALFATGHMVWEALTAEEILREKHHIRAAVINFHTIKPLDKETASYWAKRCGKVLTAEEHQVTGGFGSAVAECLVQSQPVPMHILGVNDSFGESGQPDELMKKYGLTADDIVANALKLLNHA
jgi:transketolase